VYLICQFRSGARLPVSCIRVSSSFDESNTLIRFAGAIVTNVHRHARRFRTCFRRMRHTFAAEIEDTSCGREREDICRSRCPPRRQGSPSTLVPLSFPPTPDRIIFSSPRSLRTGTSLGIPRQIRRSGNVHATRSRSLFVRVYRILQASCSPHITDL